MRRVGTTVAVALSLFPVRDFAAHRPLPDYRYFRALSIDLLGRAPTRDEISQIERADFSFDAWIDAHLTGSSYAQRIRRIYMDLLRLDLPANVQFEPPSVVLHHARIEGPDGATIDVLYRVGYGTWRLLRNNTTSTSLYLSNRASGSYAIRVRATDRRGNVGGWSGESRIWVP